VYVFIFCFLNLASLISIGLLQVVIFIEKAAGVGCALNFGFDLVNLLIRQKRHPAALTGSSNEVAIGMQLCSNNYHCAPFQISFLSVFPSYLPQPYLSFPFMDENMNENLKSVGMMMMMIVQPTNITHHHHHRQHHFRIYFLSFFHT